MLSDIDWPLLATPDNGENMPMNQNNPGDPLNAKSKTRYQATMAVAMARARQTDRDPKGVQALRKQSPQGTNNNGCHHLAKRSRAAIIRKDQHEKEL